MLARKIFAVAFAMKTLLAQDALHFGKGDLRDILYGSEAATAPPAFVPEDVAEVIVRLVDATEVPASETTPQQIEVLAQRIYDYVVADL